MDKEKKHYLDIDLIRLVSCIEVLLYHLGLLKGGYLAVCTFFVLSGYLSCVSAFKKDHFSLLSYYKNKLLKIYLPLVIIVFITIASLYFFPNIIWLNLKPETTSVLLGYNNFWQISVNLDYFARHINSPFIHLWYISILLQFDLIFPFIFIILRKVGDKINKILPCFFSLFLSIIGCILAYKGSISLPLMNVYYGTLTRVFSLLLGVTVGFIHNYYKPLSIKNKIINRLVFYSYLLLLILSFIFIDSNTINYSISFILISIISCRLIDYGTVLTRNKLFIWDKLIKLLSSLSYVIYLIQYPVIYLFQYINMEEQYKIPSIIVIILFLSFILHTCVISINKKEKFKVIKWIIRIIIIAITIYGGYQYCITKDHTAEMKQLEEQLAQNQKAIEEKQAEYTIKANQEQENWESIMNDLNNEENKVKETVTQLPLVGIGDSIMLGAVGTMTNMFPNSYFDVKVSRSAWSVDTIIKDLNSRNILGNPVILNLGANGDCSEACKDTIMKDLGDRQVYWMTVTNDQNVHFNDKIKTFAKKYNNLHIIDWNAISKGHTEYFYADGIHLTSSGRIAYTNAIYNTLYPVYLKDYNIKKEEIIKKHEEELKNKISFYGNDILLNIYPSLQTEYADSKLTLNKDYNFDLLKEDIDKAIMDNTLTYKLIFSFDKNLIITQEQYNELLDMCKEHKIYFISTNKESNDILNNINYDNVKIINFYDEINNNTDYLMADKIHLSDLGNQALIKLINDNIKK